MSQLLLGVAFVPLCAQVLALVCVCVCAASAVAVSFHWLLQHLPRIERFSLLLSSSYGEFPCTHLPFFAFFCCARGSQAASCSNSDVRC